MIRSGGLPRSVRVVRLSAPIRLAVPSLMLSSLQKNAIGFSYESGAVGALTGGSLAALSFFIGIVLYPLFGVAALALAAWGIGSTGIVMLVSSARATAFVRPLCTSCRLMPVIVEHEAAHLGGEHSDSRIWKEAKMRYSTESLHLNGDPNICGFCPIAKRLGRH